MNAVCLFLGHTYGYPLYRYLLADPSREARQWPGRTYTMAAAGYRCLECGMDVAT